MLNVSARSLAAADTISQLAIGHCPAQTRRWDRRGSANAATRRAANAWLLYVGVLFIVMVMYAPGGLIGLIFMHRPIWRAGRLRELLVPYAKAFPPVQIRGQ